MAISDCFVSVTAPLHDDADIVESFIEDVLAVLKREYSNYELVLIDDGSTDDSVARVSALLNVHECIRLIRLSRRFGTETAISAGLDSVIGDFVVVMMPETDPPSLIPQLVERTRAGVGVVYGIRRSRKDEPVYSRVGARIFYTFFNWLVRRQLPQNSTDFRAYSRQSVNALTRIKDHMRYLRTFADYVGYGSEGFEYEIVPRRRPLRRRGLGESIKLAVTMIVANSAHPLRLVSILGLVMSLFSVFYSLYVVLVVLFDENVVRGWATQSLQNSVMFVFVFLILAVLSEYVGWLIEEVRDRPLYYVLEERNSSVLIADETRKNVVTQSHEESAGAGSPRSGA